MNSFNGPSWDIAPHAEILLSNRPDRVNLSAMINALLSASSSSSSSSPNTSDVLVNPALFFIFTLTRHSDNDGVNLQASSLKYSDLGPPTLLIRAGLSRRRPLHLVYCLPRFSQALDKSLESSRPYTSPTEIHDVDHISDERSCWRNLSRCQTWRLKGERRKLMEGWINSGVYRKFSYLSSTQSGKAA